MSMREHKKSTQSLNFHLKSWYKPRIESVLALNISIKEVKIWTIEQ